MTFKQRSSGPFKMMGSSIGIKNVTPVKQIIPLSSASTPKEKALQSKIAKEFDLPVSKKGSMPKNFNTTGSSKAGKFAKVVKKVAGKKLDLVKRTTNVIHSNEMKIADLKKSRAKDIKKVKGKTVKISKKDVLKQMKKAGTKLPYSSVKNALKTSIKAAGKVAKFIPGVAGLVLSATKTATADQPKGKAKRKGSYTGDFTKLRK